MSDQSPQNTPAKPVPVTRNSAPRDGRDPNVKVPPSVLANSQRSEQLMKDRNDALAAAAAEANGEPPADGLKLTPVAPVVPQRTSVQDAPPAPAPASTPTQEELDKHAMKVRMERATKDNIRLSEEVNQLRSVMATMAAAPVAPVAPAPAELRAASLITPQEVADYGEEFLDVIGKKARESTLADIAALKQQIETLSRGVQATAQVTTEQAKDAMLRTLDEKLPEWRALNNDQNFISWLRLPDTYSGAIRQELLTSAYGQNNAARVLAFFNGFLSEEAAVSPASPPAPTPNGKVPLETLAAPSRARSAAANAPAEKPIITRAQIANFYTEVAAGKYRGRDEEKAQNEAAIFSANQEGRIR